MVGDPARNRLDTFLVGIVMVVIAIAGLAKSVDVTEFARQLHTWSLVPRVIVTPLAILLPAIELAIPGLWFTGIRRRIMSVLAFSMLCTFVIVYIVHLIVADPPVCACFGALLNYREGMATAWVVIGRDAVLLVLLASGLWLHGGERSGSAAQ